MVKLKMKFPPDRRFTNKSSSQSHRDARLVSSGRPLLSVPGNGCISSYFESPCFSPSEGPRQWVVAIGSELETLIQTVAHVAKQGCSSFRRFQSCDSPPRWHFLQRLRFQGLPHYVSDSLKWLYLKTLFSWTKEHSSSSRIGKWIWIH